jgi:hypothetical protein
VVNTCKDEVNKIFVFLWAVEDKVSSSWWFWEAHTLYICGLLCKMKNEMPDRLDLRLKEEQSDFIFSEIQNILMYYIIHGCVLLQNKIIHITVT